jgi:hypothetical protein
MTGMIGRAARMTYRMARKAPQIRATIKEDAERNRTAQERLLATLDPEQAQVLIRRMSEDASGAPPRAWDVSRSVAPPR